MLHATNELENVVLNNLTIYGSLSEYLKNQNLEKEEFFKWADQGCDDNGFIEINQCIAAGDATRGIYTPITTIKDVAGLLQCEIDETDFYDVIDMLNDDDPNNLINKDDPIEVMQVFFEYCYEIALVPIDSGLYKGGYYLVINQD